MHGVTHGAAGPGAGCGCRRPAAETHRARLACWRTPPAHAACRCAQGGAQADPCLLRRRCDGALRGGPAGRRQRLQPLLRAGSQVAEVHARSGGLPGRPAAAPPGLHGRQEGRLRLRCGQRAGQLQGPGVRLRPGRRCRAAPAAQPSLDSPAAAAGRCWAPATGSVPCISSLQAVHVLGRLPHCRRACLQGPGGSARSAGQRDAER